MSKFLFNELTKLEIIEQNITTFKEVINKYGVNDQLYSFICWNAERINNNTSLSRLGIECFNSIDKSKHKQLILISLEEQSASVWSKLGDTLKRIWKYILEMIDNFILRIRTLGLSKEKMIDVYKKVIENKDKILPKLNDSVVIDVIEKEPSILIDNIQQLGKYIKQYDDSTNKLFHSQMDIYIEQHLASMQESLHESALTVKKINDYFVETTVPLSKYIISHLSESVISAKFDLSTKLTTELTTIKKHLGLSRFISLNLDEKVIKQILDKYPEDKHASIKEYFKRLGNIGSTMANLLHIVIGHASKYMTSLRKLYMTLKQCLTLINDSTVIQGSDFTNIKENTNNITPPLKALPA